MKIILIADVPLENPTSGSEQVLHQQAMGLAARKKVEQEFSVEKMVAETEKVYLSLLKNK